MKKNLLAFALLISGYVTVAQSPRMCLFEEFTGENCGPCASTNPALNAKLKSPANVSKIVAIKWEVPIPSAPSAAWSLYQTNKPDIEWRWRGWNGLTSSTIIAAPNATAYGYPSINTNPTSTTSGINSAPSGRIDGQHLSTFGGTSDHPFYVSDNMIATAQSYTSAFTVTMTRDWSVDGSAVNVTVNIVATAPFSATGPLIFRTVMVERVINFSVAPGSNGEKTFDDVAIKAFPTLQNGVAMASNWTIGQSQTFTLNCPIPSYTRKKSEIAMVGFIQDDGNRKVAQAVRADKAPVPNDAVAVSVKVDPACTAVSPVVTVKNNGTAAITSMTILPYIDGVVSTAFNWTGNLAAGSTTTIPMTALTTPTSTGAHTFSYNISALNAVDFDPSNNSGKIAFMYSGTPSGNPVAETFSAAVPPTGWAVINANYGPAWSKITGYGAYGLSNTCTKYDFYYNTVKGDMDEFILPPVNLQGTDVPKLSFDMAYAQRDANSNDQLEVFVSSDCGANWTSFFNQAGAVLKTTDETGSAFVPDATTWKTVQLDLTGFAKPNVLVKFVTTNDNGNNLFIDNVNLYQTGIVGLLKNPATAEKIDIFPNPSAGLTTIAISNSNVRQATITMVNTLGQVVLVKKVNLNSGVNNIQLDVKDHASGVYNVVVDLGSTTISKKLTVTN